MGRKAIMLICLSVLGLMVLSISSFAGTKVSDVVEMKSSIYKAHAQKLVLFSHQKHATTYKIACSTCHHDESGKPLANLKAGDNVQSCTFCHNIPGDPPKRATLNPKSNRMPKQLTKAEQLKYYTYTIHKSCKDCHAEYNVKNNTKTAPITCAGCHTK